MNPRLLKSYSLLVFDWDGTAVSGREDPVDELLSRAEPLLAGGRLLSVVTGTHFGNIHRQFGAKVAPSLRKGLAVCANRGSEGYGYDERGRETLLFRREATPEENALLDQVAGEIKEELLSKYHLEISIASDRLNRRKLDLIPLPEWENPPKVRIGELLSAVSERLHNHSVSEGIAQIIRMVGDKSRKLGLSGKITTDVKHVEIGLTDKSDSMEYLLTTLAAEKGIRPSQILIVGDEFGPIGGFEGSDFRMVTPLAEGATYVSVGKEPNGVPPGVLHIGGGVQAFLGLLEGQIPGDAENEENEHRHEN
ncbi:MAG: hypothetical protein HYU64_07055 [Armatimonadetes bacterium]|nr:hypothetical protein [Armatimonadota bacterium]